MMAPFIFLGVDDAKDPLSFVRKMMQRALVGITHDLFMSSLMKDWNETDTFVAWKIQVTSTEIG